MKKVRVENAVGMVLAHDITRIVPGKFKGVGFKKGHVVREEDIPALLQLGKEHLYALNLPQSRMHEDEAALRIARAISGPRLRWTTPSEGKSNIISPTDGLLKINAAALTRINKLDHIIVSTLKNNFPCRQDQIVAATRIIPLTIARKKIARLEAIAAQGPAVIRVLPYRPLKVGAVVTGSEIHKGLIKDEFDKYVGRKVRRYGSRIVKKIQVPDDTAQIARAVTDLINLRCELIITTGGLSVDPDDVTRQGVRQVGADIIVYGAPILPGAMFLYARHQGTPILGLPACVYYHPSTIFDLVLPRVLAGDEITRNDIAALGQGGLCLNCEKCQFPVCPFGK
ncbi:MAG: molybdopterin-binding protein [Desulfobacterales bacterium]|nr:MAG: molybdopterin-binding protein [Desulfobacterales bacterium]